MKTLRINIVISLVVLLMGLQCKIQAQSPVVATSGNTNFIVFLTDDQGWGDLGCYGHPQIQSPNLDRFATEGIRFTQAYSACGVCSPSRSAILTGRTPYRNGVWRWIPEEHEIHLRTSEITIAELLKTRGYSTCHAGKWHLNGKFNSPEQPQPNDHGYDHWLATQNNAKPNHMNPTNFVRNGTEIGLQEGPSAVITVTEAINWLQNRPNKEEPFFITVWTHEPHLPIKTARQFSSLYDEQLGYERREYYGNITQLDHAFGLLMKALDDMDYTDNTCVFYTSDNGPEGKAGERLTRGSTGGLRGRKRSDFEGGIRVPGMVRFPAYFKAHGIQTGSESDIPIVGHDIFTTICTIAGIPIPSDRTIDGANMLPALEGKPVERTQPLYWRTHCAPQECRVALRVGDWKIVGDENINNCLLFNMQKDWKETENVASKYPDKFRELKALLLKHDASVKAEGPDWWRNEKSRKKK